MLQSIQIRLDEHQIRAGFDRQEASARHVHTVCVVEVADGRTDSCLELDDADVCLALLIRWNALAVWNDLHAELAVLHHTLHTVQIHPDVVCVEVLELLDALELVDVLLRNLSDFEQTGLAFIIDDCATLDVCLRLVRQLHNVLCFCLHHVLQDVEIDDGAEIVGVGEEEDLDSALDELIEDAGVVEGFVDVAVARWVPVGDLRVEGLGCGEKRVLKDTWVAGLVEGEDVDVVALVLLDDAGGVGVGVERVHEHERHVDVVRAVEELNLADRQIEEGHAVAHLDHGFWPDAAHGGTQTAIELEDCELVQVFDRIRVAERVVFHYLLWLWRRDSRPFDFVALGLVVEIAAEEGEEVVHFRLKSLPNCQYLKRHSLAT